LKNYRVYAGEKMRTGAEAVDYVATNYSVSPQLLLALLEYQTGALTQPNVPIGKYMLGFRRVNYEAPYLQMVIAANTLNHGYYSWRAGKLTEIELLDDTLFRPDPWQNAGSVALQYYFSRLYSGNQFYTSIGQEGFARVYQTFFGDPWAEMVTVLPGSLQQPALQFPFVVGQLWAYTGGPHTGWGSGEPLSAIDFAPASETSGCVTQVLISSPPQWLMDSYCVLTSTARSSIWIRMVMNEPAGSCFIYIWPRTDASHWAGK
jgi:hypothetical protein